jgi:hypothetical protein
MGMTFRLVDSVQDVPGTFDPTTPEDFLRGRHTRA